ncbi:ABC transporter permease [Pseudonocardia sp. KRD-184]|uniref:ABC transporter permease n=1 Tax=Pseudonocardia oceani TaxID=2792013 RepID=A0ABS6U523_9PSEU|nr:ABC transporter permease [Pseudonocardia oceani]MBW0091299.1 ABC transporter permease [Pseudonocardia oceani]MBW0097359.1 ABC transporter permease [Pseudonocardia oceani]MBW0110480.1 ABC transporter permease [Pseudonocardia oceani]MBW0124571.1 ABC transporter permease [Pseudonocardia oceani]MBW0127291.1 ABC transporter permease [Pseudonocardia oceani]
MAAPPDALTRDDAAAVAGLDALDTPTSQRVPLWRRLLSSSVPPLLTLVVVIVAWQALWASAIWPEFKLPAPIAVAEQFAEIVVDGSIWSITWTSVGRAIVGFLVAVVIATPLGLLVAKVSFVRRAIGPLLSGMQSLPSVAWVPAAVLWFGLTDATIYFVVLLGSVPSIANGLVSGIDQVPPILGRVGDVMGAGRLASARLILLPAALPGYISGCKQGWAFAWRSLMAAEIIATSPQLGVGLGAYLKQGSDVNNIAGVISAIVLILLVGVGIELLVFKPLERRVLQARGLAL